MRLRHVKNAQNILNQSDFYVSNPQDWKGNLQGLFSKVQPIHLEIGCGKGQYLIGMASKHPEINFIGIEKYDSVLVRAILKADLTSLDNLKFFCFDAKQIFDVFDHDIDTLYLNFSDPWPKKRHQERRLTSSSFLSLYDHIFKSIPHIVQKTDNIILFASSIENLSRHGYVLEIVSLDLHSTDLPNVETEYEEKFSREGIKINYLNARKLFSNSTSTHTVETENFK